MSDLYDNDFYAWTIQQATLLRNGAASVADLAQIAEELESMGRSERNQLINHLAVLLAHLLKWDFQPGLRDNSWRLTIREQRRRISRLLKQNPTLRSELADLLAEAYDDALLMAQRETGLPEDRFPFECTWTLDAVLQDDRSGGPCNAPKSSFPVGMFGSCRSVHGRN